MEFEWDEKKNHRNKEKHGIGFEDAKEVFKDRRRIEIKDERRDYGEDIWKTIGLMIGVVISVIYTICDTAVRLISARRASRKERDEYNDQ